MDIYELVRGPFAWVALIIFVAGCLFRIVAAFIAGKKEPVLYPSTSFKDALRSILHGLIPFWSTYMRRQPIFRLDHLSLLSAGVLLLALGEFYTGDVSLSLLGSAVVASTLVP